MNMNVPTWFLKKIPKLSMIPCEELPRKFLITGGENSGKTKLIANLYKKMNFVDYPEMVYAYKKTKDGRLKFNNMFEPENTFGAPK